MADRNEKIPADHIFLFKPIEGCDREGCSVYIWLPKEPKSGSVLLAMYVSPALVSPRRRMDLMRYVNTSVGSMAAPSAAVMQ